MHLSYTPQVSQQTIPVADTVRTGESGKFWFRSERFFTVQNQWFFTTREQVDVGPFTNRAAVEHGLELFIDCVANQGMEADYAISIAKCGDWTVNTYH